MGLIVGSGRAFKHGWVQSCGVRGTSVVEQGAELFVVERGNSAVERVEQQSC